MPGLGLRSQLAMLQVRHASAFPSVRHGPSLYEEKHKSPAPPPLGAKAPVFSVVPTSTLLRSLLVTTVSGHRILRVPALSILMALSKARGYLLGVEKNPVIHWFLKKTLYNHFCAGEREDQVRDTIRQLKDTGLRGVILTHARESSHGTPSAQELGNEANPYCETLHAWKEDVLKTVDLIDDGDFLAIK